MSPHFTIKPFSSINTDELYELLKLRFDVFIVEQDCIYDELDNKDQKALHIFMRDEKGRLIGCSRIFGPGKYYDEASFGRFVLQKELRGQGLAEILMQKTLDLLEENYGKVPIKIAAQSYLKNFYTRFGFQIISEEYDWGDIMHYDMLRQVQAK